MSPSEIKKTSVDEINSHCRDVILEVSKLSPEIRVQVFTCMINQIATCLEKRSADLLVETKFFREQLLGGVYQKPYNNPE